MILFELAFNSIVYEEQQWLWGAGWQTCIWAQIMLYVINI
jgi:hypothetical protein